MLQAYDILTFVEEQQLRWNSWTGSQVVHAKTTS